MNRYLLPILAILTGLLIGNFPVASISAHSSASSDIEATSLVQPDSGDCPNFTDVTADDYFCKSLSEAVMNGAVSGYNTSPPCTTGFPCFRPYDLTNRGQFAKMIVLMFGFPLYNPSQATFQDVTTSSPYYIYVETAAHRTPPLISGYTCGLAPAGPCVPPDNKPYFLPGNYITRGQISKISANAAGFTDNVSSRTPTFYDISSSHVFFPYIERGVMHDTLGPYPPDLTPQPTCGSSVQPCYFPDQYAYRADAVVHIAKSYKYRTGQPVAGQDFAQSRSPAYNLVYARVTTPLYNSSLPMGVTIAGPVAVTNRWNPYYVEAGPAEYVDSVGNHVYHPYYNWNNGQTFGSNFITNINLTPGLEEGYQVAGTPGDVWQAEYCPSGCTLMAITDSLISTPYAVVGAESTSSLYGTGSISVSSFTRQEVGGPPFVDCFDTTLLPWKKFNGFIYGCSPRGSWTMYYSP